MRHETHFILWCFALAFVLLSLLQWFSVEENAPIRWFSYFMPWTLLLLVPSALLAIYCHHNILFVCMLLPIAYIVACQAPNFLPKDIPFEPGECIDIMSFNVWSRNMDMAAIGRIVAEQAPDLLLLQEVSRRQLDEMLKNLTSAEQAHLSNVIFDEKNLLAVLSRFPLSDMHSAGTARFKIQKLNMIVRGDDLLVFNVHFIRGGNRQRLRQQEQFAAEHLVGHDVPVLVGGDFNTTPHTALYKSFASILINSHDEAGQGFGFTYPAIAIAQYNLPAMVRIDHIFHSQHFRATAAKTISVSGGSDHFPVVCRLILKKT